MNSKLLTLTGIITLLTYLLAAPTQVYACSCYDIGSIQDEIMAAPVAFTGRVTNIGTNYTKFFLVNGKTVTFQVSTIWKGPSATQLSLYTGFGGGDCGYPFEIGRDYLVYGYNHEGGLIAHICSRTRPIENAQEDLRILGEGQIPEGGVYPPLSARIQPFISIISIVLFLVGLLFLARRRRSAKPRPPH